MVEALNAATAGLRHLRQPRVRAAARHADRADRRASTFKWLSSNCTLADGTPFPKVLPWDTVRVSGHLGRPLRPHPPGRLPELRAVHRPRQRRPGGRRHAHGAEGAISSSGSPTRPSRRTATCSPASRALDLILGGHEHEAHDSVVSGRHVLKADANSRTAQFATLWGGKGDWRQAVGLVTHRLPAARRHRGGAGRGARGTDSLRARLGPERVVATAEAPIDARDALVPQPGVAARVDLVTDAMRAGTGADVALINAGALRLDDVIPAGTGQQLSAREHLSLRRRDPGRHLPPVRRPAPGSAGARRRGWLPGQGRVPAGVGHPVHLRPRKQPSGDRRLVGDIEPRVGRGHSRARRRHASEVVMSGLPRPARVATATGIARGRRRGCTPASAGAPVPQIS